MAGAFDGGTFDTQLSSSPVGNVGQTFDSGSFDAGTFDTVLAPFFAGQTFDGFVQPSSGGGTTTTTFFFEVSGSLGFGTGGVQDRFPAIGVTFPYAPVQLPTRSVTVTVAPNSSASLDFSQAANSEYIPLLIP